MLCVCVFLCMSMAIKMVSVKRLSHWKIFSSLNNTAKSDPDWSAFIVLLLPSFLLFLELLDDPGNQRRRGNRLRSTVQESNFLVWREVIVQYLSALSVGKRGDVDDDEGAKSIYNNSRRHTSSKHLSTVGVGSVAFCHFIGLMIICQKWIAKNSRLISNL